MRNSSLSTETLLLMGMGLSYDAAFKLIFSEKSVLAMILRDCVGGYDGMTLAEIESCILEQAEASSVPVAPGLTNAPFSSQQGGQIENGALRGLRTEEGIPFEGIATYDFYFEALMPGEAGPVGIHVDVEGQAHFNDAYPMANRAQYYCARMLSAQYGKTFSKSHYEQLQRVFSVWFFVDAPAELRGSIMKTETRWTSLVGPAVDPGQCDLMTVVFAFMGDKSGWRERRDVIGLLETLFAQGTPDREKRGILERNFDIAMSTRMEAGAMALSELDAGMHEVYKKRFRELGLEEGRAEGLSEGRAAGRIEGLATATRNLMAALGIQPSEALDMLGVNGDDREAVLQALSH